MIIDIAYLAQQTCGDKDLQRELLVLYATQIDEACHLIDQTFGATAADVDGMLALFHRLRGSARAVGATPLGDRLEQLEGRLIEERRPDAVREHLADLQTLARESAAFAKTLIDAREPGGLANTLENG